MAKEDYKAEMRRLIDIMTTMTYDDNLYSTVEDLKMMNDATQKITNNLETRIKSSLMKGTDKAKAKPQTQTAKPYASLKTAKKLSFKPLPKPKQSKPPNTAQQSTNTNNNNAQTKTANAGADLVSRQAKLKAIQPQKPIA